MCGITGYIGSKKAADIILAGLARLEYRGYDSAGIAIVHKKSHMTIRKKVRRPRLWLSYTITKTMYLPSES
jgi:glucosamine--fructose-6-phosphate aminotransferase (isomerizing)